MPRLRQQHTPPSPGPNLPLIRIVDTHIHTFVILAAQIFGQWTHWDHKAAKGKGASSPCFEPKEECPGCKRSLPERWKGYLHVFNLHTRVDGFLELTPTAAKVVTSALVGVDTYRGVRINVTRSSNSNQGRLRLTVLDAVRDMSPFPSERSPEETLCKLWKLENEIDEDEPPTIKIAGGTPSDKPRPDGRLAASV